MARIELLSPVPTTALEAGRITPPLSNLQGRVLGLRIEWADFERFIDRIEERLFEVGEVGRTKRWDLVMDKGVLGRASDSDVERRQREFEEFAEGTSAAIVGLAA